jgi:hypothetical protein
MFLASGRFFPMGFWRFPSASVAASTSFLLQETISTFFASLSSLMTVPHSIFAEVAAELMKIEIAVNAALGLP